MTDAITYEWTGAPDASPSVKRVNGSVVATNTLSNPSFRSGISGYYAESAIDVSQPDNTYMRVVSRDGQQQSFVVLGTPKSADFTLVIVARRILSAGMNIFGARGTSTVTTEEAQPIRLRFTETFTTQYVDLTTTPDQGNLYLAVDSPGSQPMGGFDILGLALVPGKGYRGGFFDGSSRVGTTYVWTGEPNNSPSAQAVDGSPFRTNLHPDPASRRTDTWNAYVVGSTTSTVGLVSSPEMPSGVSTILTFGHDAPVTAWNISSQNKVAVQGGRTYTFSTWGTHSWSGGATRLTVEFKDTTGKSLGYFYTDGVSTLPANTPTRISNVQTAPADAVTASVFWDAGGALPPADSAMVVSSTLVEEGTALRPYFDGDSLWNLLGFATGSSTSTSTVAGLFEFTPSVTRKSASTLTHAEASEFLSIVSRISDSESAAWGSVPALLNVDYDSVGPFWVGDSPLTAWAIEVNSEVNLYGVFDSGEVTILDPAGQVVAVRPSPFIDADTLIITIPVGTFTTAGVYRLVPRLLGRGSVTLESVPVVVQADDGWHSLESARQTWPEAPSSDEALYRLLETARVQCVEFAPAFVGRAPVNYAAAQLMQARSLWNSGNVRQDDQFGGGQLTVTVFPMDWSVKALLRPKRAIGAFF